MPVFKLRGPSVFVYGLVLYSNTHGMPEHHLMAFMDDIIHVHNSNFLYAFAVHRIKACTVKTSVKI